MNRLTILSVIGITTLALALTAPTPARAQIVPLGRNAVSFSLATYSAAPVYSFGGSFALNPSWDATLAYSFQSTPSTSGNLLGVGVRYHFAIPTPGIGSPVGVPAPSIDPYVTGGFASVSGTLPGFGTLAGSGLFVGAGLTLKMGNLFSAYARSSLYAIGGTSNAITDIGIQASLAPLVSTQFGYISFAGNGAIYIGVVAQLP